MSDLKEGYDDMVENSRSGFNSKPIMEEDLGNYLINPSLKKEPNTFISNIDPHKVVLNGVNLGSLFDLVMSNDTVHGKPAIEVAREIIKENMV